MTSKIFLLEDSRNASNFFQDGKTKNIHFYHQCLLWWKREMLNNMATHGLYRQGFQISADSSIEDFSLLLEWYDCHASVQAKTCQKNWPDTVKRTHACKHGMTLRTTSCANWNFNPIHQWYLAKQCISLNNFSYM